jgi:MoxR-like ATPase
VNRDTATATLQDILRHSTAAVLNAKRPAELLLASIISGSHVIIQGAPGTGKTALAKKVSQLMGLTRCSLHCTTDSVADDLGDLLQVGVSSGHSSCHILSLDEIHRATPGFQSVFLELMEEGMFTRGARHCTMPAVFSLVATQSSCDSLDLSALSEAQMDRFGMIIPMSVPTSEQLISLLEVNSTEAAKACCSVDEVAAMQRCSTEITLPDRYAQLIAEIIAATSPESSHAPDIVKRYVKYGAGVRAAQVLAYATRAMALLNGRDEVSRDDIYALIDPVLGHRLVLNFSGFANAIAAHSVLEAVKQRFF